MISKEKIIELLSARDANTKKSLFNHEDVEKFASYCLKLVMEKNRDQTPKNPWMDRMTEDKLATLFKRVAKDGLILDGQHITIQSTGVSYDYIAYKNKMFLVYPESSIDVSLVMEGDEFTFQKDSGKVEYKHKINNPFDNTKKLLGGYCVIKNKRGDYLTLLTEEEIEKHRKVAKTDSIWRDWFKEMALKTVIKKACKQHFSDIFQNVETIDNESSDLELPVEADLAWKQEVEAIDTIEELKDYYNANKGRGKDFDKLVSIRKAQILEKNGDIQISDTGDSRVAGAKEGDANSIGGNSDSKPEEGAGDTGVQAGGRKTVSRKRGQPKVQ